DESLDIGGADVYFENIGFTPKAGQAVKVKVAKNRGYDDSSYKFDAESIELLPTQYHAATAEEAEKMFNEGATVVDARSYGEWQLSHIKGAVSLPITYIGRNCEKVLPDKNAVILVYSREAEYSKEAAQDIVTFGYGKVYDIGVYDDYINLPKEAK
ncbi:MAG: rhodanese-like domain-containing protein, partial [Oscillospiraceae bacterium]|nr:rhodanese-like domain-containing protein [Candidatus Equicaccousia limihippi]